VFLRYRVFFFLLPFGVLTVPLRAITWNPSMTDPAPNTNRNISALSIRLGSDRRFQGVGIVRSSALSGTGTLIAPRWILTAKHVVQQAKEGSFFLEGTNVPITRFVPHPLADLALGELARPPESYPITPLWTFPTGTNQLVWLVGYGQHGEFTGKPEELSPRFQGRYAARNRIEDFLFLEGIGDLLRIRYDAGNQAVEHEGAVAPGDSGGPCFVDEGGRIYLAAITHGVHPPLEGFFFVRVRPYLRWIQSVLKSQ
jgi:hypothetical protein